MERAVYFILRADFLLLGCCGRIIFSFGWVEFAPYMMVLEHAPDTVTNILSCAVIPL